MILHSNWRGYKQEFYVGSCIYKIAMNDRHSQRYHMFRFECTLGNCQKLGTTTLVEVAIANVFIKRKFIKCQSQPNIALGLKPLITTLYSSTEQIIIISTMTKHF